VRLDRPAGLCLNPGGHLVFADSNNACVRAVNVNAPGGGSLVVGLVTVAEGDIRTVAGNGAAGTDDNVAATSATPGILDRPRGLASDSAGNLFVADSLNNRLMVVNASAGSSTTQAGVTVAAGYIRAVKGQPGVHAAVEPRGCCVHNNVLYMADAQSCRIVAKDLATGALSVVAGSGARGSADGPLLSATFDGPTDVKMEAGGRFLVVCDSNNSAVRVVNVSGNVISAYTIFSLPAGQVGTVDTSGSPLAVPMSLALETDGTPSCFVADTGNHRVVLLDYMTGSMTPIAGTLGSSGFAGDSGAATSCNLDSPVGVAIDSSYNVFVADTANHAVRLVNRSASVIAFGTVTVNPGEIETIAGFPPPSAQSGYDGDNKPALYSLLDSPTHLLVDGSGHVYFCDERNHRIRTLNATTGLIDTVAGTGTLGYNGDGLPPLNSWISSPSGLALSGGVLYFSDTGNAIVRRFKP